MPLVKLYNDIRKATAKANGAVAAASGTASLKRGSKTWDSADTADDATATTTVTVTGALVGDPVQVGFSLAVPAGAILTGHVTAANTVTVTLLNKTGGALNLGSGTLVAQVLRHTP